jgi:hypothetical protein
MAEKKRMYETEMMAIPPQRFVLGDMPVLNLDGRYNAGLKPLKLDPEMENTVKRLIAHLKDEK